MKKVTLVALVALMALFALGSTACGTDEQALKAEAKAEAQAEVAEAKKEAAAEVADAKKEAVAEAKAAAAEAKAEAKREAATRGVALTDEMMKLNNENIELATKGGTLLSAGDISGCAVVPKIQANLDNIDGLIAEASMLASDVPEVRESVATLTAMQSEMRSNFTTVQSGCNTLGY